MSRERGKYVNDFKILTSKSFAYRTNIKKFGIKLAIFSKRNQELQNKTSVPLCCNEDSILDVDKFECKDQEGNYVGPHTTDCGGAYLCDHRSMLKNKVVKFHNDSMPNDMPNDVVCVRYSQISIPIFILIISSVQ